MIKIIITSQKLIIVVSCSKQTCFLLNNKKHTYRKEMNAAHEIITNTW